MAAAWTPASRHISMAGATEPGKGPSAEELPSLGVKDTRHRDGVQFNLRSPRFEIPKVAAKKQSRTRKAQLEEVGIRVKTMTHGY